jgi:hypothetical protein
MSQYGGKRAGAGRKPGSQTKRTSAIAAAAAAAGIAPVEVMLQIMRTAFAAGDFETALDAANKAAPYTSPRLSAVAIDMGGLSEQELRDLAA